ncbi:MAG: RecX family transcriptional regulator [bacterium]
MKITKIERAKKNKFKVNIFIDGEFSFSVYEDVFLKMKIQKDMEIDGSFIEKAKSASEFERNKLYLLNILSRKNYTERELHTKLMQRKVERESAESLIENIRRMGFLDDDKYIKDYMNFLMDSKKYSKQEIFQKMRMKFNDEEKMKECEVALKEYDEKEVLKKLMKKIKSDIDKNKIISRLMRKGFKYEDISDIMKTIQKED